MAYAKRKKNFKKGGNSRPKSEPNNYQDMAEKREFEKGRMSVEDKGKGKFGDGKPNYQFGPKNDISWYWKNPKMATDAASIPYTYALGSRNHWEQLFQVGTNIQEGQVTSICASTDTMPGLMALNVGITPGFSQDAASPINMAAQNIYTFVRYKNSGASNYDAPDLMMYILAMDSLYACWNWMKRLYGLISEYSPTNYYRPVAYMDANNVDLENLSANLADFRAFLNTAAAQITSFCVPATLPYNVRHSWIFSNVYMDANSNKAQEYMFVPSYFYQYDETSSSQGGVLKAIPIVDSTQTTKLTFSALQSIMRNMINALQYSEDIGIMSGDILKAYGQSGLFTLSPVEPDYVVTPVYNDKVLSQIENATIIDYVHTPTGTWNADNISITQDPNTNFIMFQPILAKQNTIMKGAIVNQHIAEPTPQDTMYATRLLALGVQKGSDWYLSAAGSEVVVDATVWYLTTQTTSPVLPTSPTSPLVLAKYTMDEGIAFDVLNEANLNVQLTILSVLAAFDWHPIQYLFIDEAPLTADWKRSFIGCLMDWDKYGFVSTQNMETLHSVALLSEFDVPNGSNF